MDNNLQNMIANLETAVRIMMDPGTVQQLRLQAYQTCEDFKENSNQCAQCGVIMSGKDRDPITRHFGLQLIEHCVKFRWNKMTIEEKKFLKESTLKIISEGTLGLLEEQLYIKDALSRIVVEMAKREWPQQWPSMLSELDSIYSLGPTQTELVLLIFLRLAEDILIFQSAPAQRRRDITQGLTNVMQQLFPWFINTLESNVTAYKHALYQTDERTQMFNVTSSRVAVAAVETITAFIDWINISHIIDQDGRLLRLLCAMLDDVNLRLSAVECLLAITSRKGKLEDRQPILILFSTEAMSIILNAAILAATAELDEQNYVFLKRLCQVLAALGSQLSTLWGSAKDVGQPVTFHQYLEGLLAFTDHSSLMLCGYTLPLWSSFLKHEHISKDPILLNFIPRLVTSAASTLVKAGFPSQNNSPRCRYSRLDFDCDEDFFTFFSRLRADCADMLRWAAAICPEMMFRFVASRIEEQLKKPLDLGEGCDHGHCNLSSPSFLEWDALTVFLESVMSRFPTPEKDTPLYNDGLLLFNTVLSYDTMFWENGFKDLTLQTVVSKPLDDISTGCLKHRDPLIRSAVLSVISALFPFIVHSPNILTVVLDKIFTTAVFSLPGQTKATRSRAVKNVRRHACSVLVKICKLYPNLLLPGFDELYRHIQHLSSNPDELSQMEKCTLMEALILISNQNKNYEKQMRFLSEIVDPLKVVWLSDEVKEALWSVDKFIKFVGLDQSPVEPSISDVCGISRSQLAYCIVSILAVLKRSQCPEVTEEAAAGGFMATSESGVSYVRNPATPVLMGLIDNVLRLCRTVNELYLAENLAKRHPGFSRSYDILDIDKLMFLGVQPHLTDNTNNSTCKQPLDRMQSFMTLLHENCFHILGNIGRMVGYEFYRLPNLASSLLNSLCMHLEALPDYRLRAFIRSFLKPFVFWCPKEFYSSAVLPILARIGKHFHERLLSKWEVINQKCEESSGDEENSESQELLEELIVRHLTREYLDFLGVVFREKKGSTLEVGDEMVTDDSEASKKAPREEKIGDLGLLVLQDSAIFPSMVHTVFVTLSWNDTITCMKALNWCVPILKQMLVPPVRLSSEDAMYLLGAVIMGLNMHGQHEGAQSILLHTALQVYELLIPDFRGITDVMLQISSCSANNLKKFTDMITMSANPQQRVSDKKKKEMFKSLVLDAIGKNIGQQFKKEVNIRNLAPFQTHRPKMARLDEVETCDIGLCALFMKEADDLS